MTCIFIIQAKCFLNGRNIFCKYLCSLVTDLTELLCILLGKALHAIVGYNDFTFSYSLWPLLLFE